MTAGDDGSLEAIPGLGRGVLPDHGGAGIGNVAASVAEALDAPAGDLLPPVDGDRLPGELLEDVEAVVLLVVDGLGWEAYRGADLASLPELAADGSGNPLTSVLPSTTATALTTLHLGAAPAHHGLVAPFARLREQGVTGNLLRWTTADGAAPLRDRGIEVHDVVGAPALPGVLGDAGLATRALTRDEYVGSPLSRVLYRGADVEGFEDLDGLVRRIPKAARGEDLVLAYWDGLDATGHLQGPGSEDWDGELARVDAAVGRVAEALDPGTLLLVTSDHGFVPTPAPLALDVDDHPDLLGLLGGPPTGEVRWRFLASEAPGEVRAYVGDRLGHAVDVLDQGALLEAGAYGPSPPTEAVRARYEDLVLVPRGERSILVRHGEDPAPRLAGHHGGPDPAEMLVPLIGWRPDI